MGSASEGTGSLTPRIGRLADLTHRLTRLLGEGRAIITITGRCPSGGRPAGFALPARQVEAALLVSGVSPQPAGQEACTVPRGKAGAPLAESTRPHSAPGLPPEGTQLLHRAAASKHSEQGPPALRRALSQRCGKAEPETCLQSHCPCCGLRHSPGAGTRLHCHHVHAACLATPN